MPLVCTVATVVLLAIAAPLTIAAAEPPQPDGPPPEEISELPEYPDTAPKRPEGKFEDAKFFWFSDNTGAVQWEDPLGVQLDGEHAAGNTANACMHAPGLQTASSALHNYQKVTHHLATHSSGT